MSTKRVETDCLDLVVPSLVAGAFLMACLWGGCSQLSRVRDIEVKANEQMWDIIALKDEVRTLSAERHAKQSPANVISCDEYKRLVSAVPGGSTIILNSGTVVEGPCK